MITAEANAAFNGKIAALEETYAAFIEARDDFTSIGAPDHARKMNDMANVCTRHITAILRSALKEATA
jgi:hypothetical protein